MPILNAIMVPHPPLIIPRVGRGEEKKIQATIDGCREAAALVANAKPDTVVVITPHSTLYADWFHISPGKGASGSFARFGAADVKITVRYDTLFAETLSRRARERHIRAGTQGGHDPADLSAGSPGRNAFAGYRARRPVRPAA